LKPSELRQAVEISFILPKIKNVAFLKDQNIIGKDLLDVCELLGYEYHPKGSVIYENGDTRDKMYIILDGEVECSNDMEKNHLCNNDVCDLEKDMCVQNLTQQFQKYIN
jgi:hypothetical protein